MEQSSSRPPGRRWYKMKEESLPPTEQILQSALKGEIKCGSAIKSPLHNSFGGSRPAVRKTISEIRFPREKPSEISCGVEVVKRGNDRKLSSDVKDFPKRLKFNPRKNSSEITRYGRGKKEYFDVSGMATPQGKNGNNNEQKNTVTAIQAVHPSTTFNKDVKSSEIVRAGYNEKRERSRTLKSRTKIIKEKEKKKGSKEAEKKTVADQAALQLLSSSTEEKVKGQSKVTIKGQTFSLMDVERFREQTLPDKQKKELEACSHRSLQLEHDDLAIPTSPSLLPRNDDSSQKRAICKALYRVEAIENGAAFLEALHVEVFLNGREDLKRIRYDATTTGHFLEDGTSPITNSELYLGDLVVVRKLHQTDDLKESRRIAKCVILQRDFIRNRLSCAAHRKKGLTEALLSTEGSKRLVSADVKTFPDTSSDSSILKIDLFVPSNEQRRFIKQAENRMEKHAQSMLLSTLTLPTIHYKAEKVELAEDSIQKAFIEGDYPTNIQEMAVMLFRRFGVSVPAQAAVEAMCSTTALHPQAQLELERSNDSASTFHFSDYGTSAKFWKKGEVEISEKKDPENISDDRFVSIFNQMSISDPTEGEDPVYSGVVQRVIKYKKRGCKVIFEVRGSDGKELADVVKRFQNKRYEIRQCGSDFGVLEEFFLNDSVQELYRTTEKLRKQPHFIGILNALHQEEPICSPNSSSIQGSPKVVVDGKTVELNPEQNAAVDAIVSLNAVSPTMAMTAAFGSGKTFVISIANSRLCEVQGLNDIHVVVAQTNNAVANAVDAAKKVDGPPIVRVISKQNYDTEDRTTEFDLPEALKKFFLDPVTHKRLNGGQLALVDKVLSEMHKPYKIIPGKMKPKQIEEIRKRIKRYKKVVQLFCSLYAPRRIFATTATFLGSFRTMKVWKASDVKSIIIDEASQLSEAMFFALIATFTKARIVLVGDEKQLPPYSPSAVTPLLKKLATGDLFENVVRRRLFPVYPLRGIYRCHPKITKILSDNFYDGQLVSMVSEEDKSSALRRLRMSNPKHPMIFLDVEGQQEQVGTSWKNAKECDLIVKLAEVLVRNREFKCSEIAILSLYKPQMEAISDACYESKLVKDVFVGTVDSAQGKEWLLTIVSTVRTSSPSYNEFLCDKKRANVALSRGKEACIVFGRQGLLSTVDMWSSLIQEMHIASAADFIRQNGN